MNLKDSSTILTNCTLLIYSEDSANPANSILNLLPHAFVDLSETRKATAAISEGESLGEKRKKP